MIAKLDVVEGAGGSVVPVDYKKGSPQPDGSPWPSDEVQVCLQALLLRERGYQCDQAELWYAETRQRVQVELTPERLNWAADVVADARAVADQARAPLPLVDSPKCPRCSLVGLCLPDETNALLPAASSHRAGWFPAILTSDRFTSPSRDASWVSAVDAWRSH